MYDDDDDHDDHDDVGDYDEDVENTHPNNTSWIFITYQYENKSFWIFENNPPS